jgi:hypothetical protein
MLKGFTETEAWLSGLEASTRAKLAELLAEFGVEVSAAQKAAVARATGHLAAGLGVDLLLDRLRVRIGLLSLKSGRNSRYYGRFVEFGRRAQTVRVIRGTSASKRSASARRKRAAGADLRKPYSLRVKPMAPRPFVNLPGIDERLARRTADFWSGVLGG